MSSWEGIRGWGAYIGTIHFFHVKYSLDNAMAQTSDVSDARSSPFQPTKNARSLIIECKISDVSLTPKSRTTIKSLILNTSSETIYENRQY